MSVVRDRSRPVPAGFPVKLGMTGGGRIGFEQVRMTGGAAWCESSLTFGAFLCTLFLSLGYILFKWSRAFFDTSDLVASLYSEVSPL